MRGANRAPVPGGEWALEHDGGMVNLRECVQGVISAIAMIEIGLMLDASCRSATMNPKSSRQMNTNRLHSLPKGFKVSYDTELTGRCTSSKIWVVVKNDREFSRTLLGTDDFVSSSSSLSSLIVYYALIPRAAC